MSEEDSQDESREAGEGPQGDDRVQGGGAALGKQTGAAGAKPKAGYRDRAQPKRPVKTGQKAPAQQAKKDVAGGKGVVMKKGTPKGKAANLGALGKAGKGKGMGKPMGKGK